MRRFFLTLFLAVAAVYLLTSEGRKTAVAPPPADRLTVAAPSPTPSPANAEAKAQPAASAQAPQQIAAAPAIAQRGPETAVLADTVSYAASHTTSSASANATEEELGKLSLVDLKSTVQRELTRLGCYGGKVDGLWGRKSEAAVRAFNERSGANLNARPSAKLAKVLRAVPDGACKSDCQGTSCATATLKTDGTNGADTSYLPPWMRAARLASADPKAAPVSDAVAPERKKTAKARDRAKIAREAEPKRTRKTAPPVFRSAHGWGPEGWPGTAREGFR